MISLIALLAFVLVVTLKSISHALGVWLVMMIAHGFLVEVLGPGVIHLPLYSGLIILAAILARKQWNFVQHRSLMLFAILTLVMLIASAQGLDPGRSLNILMLYLKVFMLALLIGGALRTETDVKLLTLYCLGGTVFGALIAIYQYKTGTFTLQNIYVTRAAGLNGDPNDTAMLLLAGVPLAVYWAHAAKKISFQIFFMICLLMLLSSLMLTGSRGGFVSLILISMLFYLRKPSVKATFAGIILVVVAIIILPQSYIERINTLTTGEAKHGGKSLDKRRILLETGVVALFKNPVLGAGAGNYSAAFEIAKGKGVLPNASAGIGKSSHFTAHNMYLEFFIENGFVGGLLLLMIFFISVKNLLVYDRVMKRPRRDRFSFGFCTSLALISMLFSCLFLSQAKSPVLWFLVGLGLAVTKIKPEKIAIDDSVGGTIEKYSKGVILKHSKMPMTLNNK